MLGGLTVLFFLPAPISTAHAGLAEIFFCLTVAIALFTSPGWIARLRRTARAPVDDPMLRRVATATTRSIYAQILVGATMRHTGAGLAIPDFPLMFGHLIPPLGSEDRDPFRASRRRAASSRWRSSRRPAHVFYHHRDRRELRAAGGAARRRWSPCRSRSAR